ncbi:SIR2 family protein [Vagococcus lutrae]|uniref:SIR2 family protein n=1 Tax=Vagococcus lutrae TaxID=81947 RepID=UPI00200FDDBD|nr:SIR2 family protein [Vagococcus lutrae]UQF37865.1 SIR2 family protein [Vagococcus lutrae]
MWVEGKAECNCQICQTHKGFQLPYEIIEAAKNERLVLFCGAGISTESKSVMPSSFYSEIHDYLNSNYQLDLEYDLEFSELMTLFTQKVYNGNKELINRVKSRFDYINSFPELRRSATTFHRELAKIPQIKTIVTTNWDTYFEEECNAAPIIYNEDVPFWDTVDRRVFKIHGSINNVGSIVATQKDYIDCYKRLSSEPIGDRLKTILASDTVVFIGFSFGDEDLNKILEILSSKLGSFANQFYVVTLDENWKSAQREDLKPIITDGTFFLHSLKNKLIDDGVLYNHDIYLRAKFLRDKITTEHTQVLAKEEYLGKQLTRFPELYLIHAYQDGLIHGYEYCINNRPSGSYLYKDYILTHFHGYHELIHESKNAGDWKSIYYFTGYQMSLLSLLLSLENDEINYPPSYIYIDENNIEDFLEFESIEEYILFLQTENLSETKREKIRHITQGFPTDSIPHTPPWPIR